MTEPAQQPDWIAADWGTTYLRVWAMRGTDVLDHRSVRKGMGVVRPEEFGAVLEETIAGWGPAPVMACGMVGSRQGWAEAPYVAAPCAAKPQLVRVPDHAARAVYIACGIRQDSPPDVMRGEETQIAGLLAFEPDFAGVVCLPGTHTKWVGVAQGQITGFRSCMTGEIFDLLSNQSVLRHTLSAQADDMDAFDAAVAEALDDPAGAYGALFALRAGGLLHDLSPREAASRLSGLLIGWELAATRSFWTGARVALIGSATLSPLYARALAGQGLQAETHAIDPVTLAGLNMARQSLGAFS
ncbi:2-keto-3-deoxy-galactonokinase [Thioclava dalianensis]|uniref:2-keto-3-deoxy-galactonokinase n=1 Tax=Thioclava dalianensis TaxID=1185766 RepID=A0A074TFS0_9RHOB|nr:2-dehydro-3-deoxygalactonokinase [Thioclava dalianensis]KEP70576.1 2-keto-3-deoxy-galactonokinase [Thioclava dalianensis]SFN07311.1 2-dehydro-3-deoxygalactonokinase [Thioclava dalianensis]